MKFTLIYHSQLADQIDAIVDWYGLAGEGLSDSFIGEFHHTIETIKGSPYAFAIKLKGTRQVKMHRFPYFVIYEIHENRIEVINITHVNQHPIRRIMKK